MVGMAEQTKRMRASVSNRVDALKAAFLRPWVIWVGSGIILLWTLSEVYDTLSSQWLPKSWAERVPRVFDVIEWTSELLSPGTWALIFALFVVCTAIEYAVRQRPQGAARRTSDLDRKIEFEWNPVLGSLTNPPHSRYCCITLVPLSAEVINGSGTTTIGPGGAIMLRNGYECRVVNHSKTPIFNVSFDLQCVFKAADHAARPSVPGGSLPKIVGQGAEVLRRPWRVSAPRLDGDGQPFTFYIDNPNDVWVDVVAPEDITFERLGSAKKETALLIAPYRNSVTLPPPML